MGFFPLSSFLHEVILLLLFLLFTGEKKIEDVTLHKTQENKDIWIPLLAKVTSTYHWGCIGAPSHHSKEIQVVPLLRFSN